MIPQDLPLIQVSETHPTPESGAHLFGLAYIAALRAKPARRRSSVFPRLAMGADLGAGSAVAAPVTPPLTPASGTISQKHADIAVDLYSAPLTVTRDKATPMLLSEQAI